MKGPSLCNVKNVSYEGSCELCVAKHRTNPESKCEGIYVGQTYRTLFERSIEHLTPYSREESSSFIFKHLATVHKDSKSPPKFNLRCFHALENGWVE